jgi:hypothetical protein
MQQLERSADCFLSLHRAEGLSLGLLDAVMRGASVIATNYGGNTDFMRSSNSHLVPFVMTRVGNGNSPYDPDEFWAEPDLHAAAEFIRAEVARPKHLRGASTPVSCRARQIHSPSAVALRIAQRLQHIEQATRRRELDARNLLEELVLSGPSARNRRFLRRTLWSARRALLRLMRPATAHQEQINLAIIAELTGLRDQVAGRTPPSA